MRYLLAFCAALLCGDGAIAQPGTFPEIHAEVRTSDAAKELCDAFPSECVPSSIQEPVPFSRERWDELLRISSEVNDTMRYRSDWEKYHVDEKWTADEDEGDCEEFALLKRRKLIGRGWPPSMLLVTIVQKSDQRMHAVLAARTSHGDIILDNKLDDGSTRLWFWYDISRYTFVAQQSTRDPRQWVSLLPRSVIETDWRLEHWTASK